MLQLPARLASLHRALVWFSSVVLACWLLSGFLHPLMSLLAPKPQRFTAPSLQVTAATLQQGWDALRVAQGEAAVIRVVPGPDGALWQLTDGLDRERRYLRMDGSTFDGGEQAYARWLATWYLGDDAPIVALRLQSEFDDAYPWVNRLLPVWRAEIGGEHPRTAWLHTETGTLASLGDANRTRLQTLFRALHTLSWLDTLEPLRVALVATAMLSVLVLASSGLYLFWRRRGAPGTRRWHRRLGIVVALPLLLMAGSGLLHAVVFAGPAPARGLLIPAPLPPLPANPDWSYLGGVHDTVALRDIAGRVVLVHREASSVATEVAALDRSPAPSMQALLRHTASVHGAEVILDIAVVPHFSPDYDFRNRRLPAWVVHTADGHRVAVDAYTGQQLDRLDGLQRSEGWVFSFLHKWQPLAHAFGSPALRDALQVGWLALLLPLALLGWRLRRRAIPLSVPRSRI